MTIEIRNLKSVVWIMHENVPTEAYISDVTIAIHSHDHKPYLPQITYFLRDHVTKKDILEMNSLTSKKFVEYKLFDIREELVHSLLL